MNAHARHNTCDKRPVKPGRIDRIVMEQYTDEPLIDRLDEVYDAFLLKTDSVACANRTSEITKVTNYAKEDHVRRKLWALVRAGYIAAYRLTETEDWIWVRLEKAESMLGYRPYLLTSYDDLEKRVISEDWVGERKVTVYDDGQPI